MISEELAKTPVSLLSAGFGTRLRPLTNEVPKPLIEVCGKPLIVWHLERLRDEGFQDIYVNVHYLAEKLIEYLGDGSRWGVSIKIVTEDPILDTGGAVRNIAQMISADRLIVINSDSLFNTEFSIASVLTAHCDSKSLATLVVRHCAEVEKYGALGLASDKRIVKFLDAGSDKDVVERVMFAGVQVIERKAISYLDQFGEVSSLTKDLYRFLVARGELLSSFMHDGYWNDVGTLERLTEARKSFMSP